MKLFSNQCHNGQLIWTYVSHMIYFHIVEKYQPNHALRQFMLQMPPTYSFTASILHQIDLRGRHNQDWHRIHAEHITMWDLRNNFYAVATHEPTVSDS